MTPKERFLISGHAKAFLDMINSEHFGPACDYALLELQYQIPPNTTPNLPTDPYVGLDANAQMWGAKRVIEILKQLAEPVKEPEPLKRESLHY